MTVAVVPEHPYSGFFFMLPQQCNATVRRRNTPSHGFQFNSRYTKRRPVRMIWHGIFMREFTNVRNSIFKITSFSLRCFWAQRPVSGNQRATML